MDASYHCAGACIAINRCPAMQSRPNGRPHLVWYKVEYAADKPMEKVDYAILAGLPATPSGFVRVLL